MSKTNQELNRVNLYLIGTPLIVSSPIIISGLLLLFILNIILGAFLLILGVITFYSVFAIRFAIYKATNGELNWFIWYHLLLGGILVPILGFGVFYTILIRIKGLITPINPFYFSTITFSSLGLGQTPFNSAYGQIAVATESILGYIYLGIFVAFTIEFIKFYTPNTPPK